GPRLHRCSCAGKEQTHAMGTPANGRFLPAARAARPLSPPATAASGRAVASASRDSPPTAAPRYPLNGSHDAAPPLLSRPVAPPRSPKAPPLDAGTARRVSRGRPPSPSRDPPGGRPGVRGGGLEVDGRTLDFLRTPLRGRDRETRALLARDRAVH